MALRLSNADKGWRRRFEDPIPLPAGASWSRSRMPATISPSCPSDGMPDPRGDVGRADDVCVDWSHEGIKPLRRASVLSVAQRSSLGTVSWRGIGERIGRFCQ
jgi:hypothetical protein